MQYKEFTVINFKGIQNLNLRFDNIPLSPIVTLVGLNESGKTTILEALNFFYESLEEKDEIKIQPQKVEAVHSLIPKRLRDNFNGEIVVGAVLTLEESDNALISDMCASYKIKPLEIGSELSIRHSFNFRNSRFNENYQEWNIYIRAKKARGSLEFEVEDDHEVWGPLVDALEKRIPPIIYYPNFLFNFPERIYLEPTLDEAEEQIFYRRLVQDVLDSLKNDLTISDHLVARAQSPDDSDSEALESVVNKMSSRIAQVAFDPQLSVFGHSPATRSIRVIGPKRDEAKNAWFLEIKIKDGDDTFYVRERSLGFRWFFAFLIFTQFRVQRTEGDFKPLFLFDEPASNLHQTAQQRLLRAFEQLSNEHGTRIVYTTHSHHLVEPKWLEGTYIVKNQALSYEVDTAYTSAMTDISVVKYRTFVSAYPDQRTYFQPILDVLDYRPSNLESIPNVIMLEGKNDFYAISYMNDVMLGNLTNLNLLPGGGAGSVDCPIQLYYAWGRDFRVLLDSDSEGISQKQRYKNKFGKIVDGRLFTLEDMSPDFVDTRIEDLFEKDDQLTIQRAIQPEAMEFDKHKFFLAIQECLVCKKNLHLTAPTIRRFKELISQLSRLFDESLN